MKNKEAKKVFITDGAACMKKRKKEEKSKKLKYSFFPTDGAACSAEASTTLVDTTHIISLGKKMMKIMMILMEMVISIYNRKVLCVCLFVTFLFIPARLVFHGSR